VIRIVGEKLDSTNENVTEIPVHWVDNLEEAVTTAISLAKSAVK
jgi:hypothetical protein